MTPNTHQRPSCPRLASFHQIPEFHRFPAHHLNIRLHRESKATATPVNSPPLPTPIWGSSKKSNHPSESEDELTINFESALRDSIAAGVAARTEVRGDGPDPRA